MPAVEQSIDVNVGVGTAYDLWTRFEAFPRWMEGVASIEQTRDERIAWQSVGGEPDEKPSARAADLERFRVLVEEP
jgi:uncharacterized membrane protein